MIRILVSIVLLLLQTVRYTAAMPQPTVHPYVAALHIDQLGGIAPVIKSKRVSRDVTHIEIRFNLPDSVHQDDWKVSLRPAFRPDFHWSPHLTPTADHIIAQHVFRAPALLVTGEQKQITLVPDLDCLQEGPVVPWYMDLDAPRNELVLGMGRSTVKEHVLYTRAGGALYPPGEVVVAFYLLTAEGKQALANPWRQVLTFLWEHWGAPLYRTGAPLGHKDLLPYVQHTYRWAFHNWKQQVWQELELGGKPVGAPVFIVNTTQSPNYPGEVNEREFRSIWNQAWFNSLRSAQGLYRYAKRTGDERLLDYARKTKELALAFPQHRGFFPGLIATEMQDTTIDGERYNRSKGWGTYYFGNSNRNPYTGRAEESPYHILDMSYTAWLMLTWYDELEQDRRLVDYATRYADGLLSVQRPDGFFPGWLTLEKLEPMQHLNQSPETSMSVTFLLQLYEATGAVRYKEAALKAMQAVMSEVIPTGRWEDFETYWSCSRYGEHDLVNRKVTRNNLFKQNTLGMYWTAQALLACYRLTGKQVYLAQGQRTLDELLMAQAVWQPPFIHVPALGGFGVMNADGEWNDSRQSLFAELILQYGKVLNSEEYTQRGLAALRASFVMMYCPENPQSMAQWQQAWPFFGEADYGFMMENYGHGGVTDAHGLGIGEFTIYDWGNGAAAEAYNRIVDHYGEDFIRNY